MGNNEQFKNTLQGRIPAPQTLDFMQKITESMATINEKLQNLEKGMEKNSDDHRILFKKIDDFIECAPRKYASKEEVQFLRNIFIASILIVIFIGIITLLLNKFL